MVRERSESRLSKRSSRSSGLDWATTDAYTWHDQEGWRSYRLLRPGRGMFHDVRRRSAWYWSDIKDGISYRAFAGCVRIFFVNLLPAIAFQLDMQRRTGYYYGLNEALFSSALAALVFSTLSAQPITVVGITGLISLFNYTIYDIVAEHDIALYPKVMVWVAIWTAITHWIVAFGNLCDYMRYITDFSSNTFAMYVGTIYIEKGVQELIDQFNHGTLRGGYLSCIIAIAFFATVWFLEFVGNTIWFKPKIRGLLSDYAYPIASIFWTGFAHFPGRLSDSGLRLLPITKAFYPSVPGGRSWLVPFWELEVKWIFVSLPIGILLTLLFYYDHNVSSLTAQAKQFPLKKPAGFHWDFFLLGCTSFIAGIIGIPLPNGLVPQAPVHTDALTFKEDRLEIIHTDEGEGVQIYRKKQIFVSVCEQRVSHFVMALALVGMMTGPLLTVLGTMPRALFAGVFFIVGWGGVSGNNLMQKFLYLISDRIYLSPDTEPMTALPKRRIAYFLFWQLIAVAATVAISQTIGAIGFPVLITALIPFRWCVMPKMFTPEELKILDDLTANNPAVLVSLGGKPEKPEEKIEREIFEEEQAEKIEREEREEYEEEEEEESEREGPREIKMNKSQDPSRSSSRFFDPNEV